MGAVVLQQAVSNVAPSWLDLLSELLRVALALGAVCALAWIVLRVAAARGLGGVARGKRLEVIERLQLDGQRSVYLVRVEQRRLLIGVGSGAAPQLLAELDGARGSADPATGSVLEDLSSLRSAARRDAAH